MASPSEPGQKDTSTSFLYFKWEEKFRREKPDSLLMEAPPDFPSINFEYERGLVEVVHDLRGREADSDTDRHAFAVRRLPVVLSSFETTAFKAEYLPRVEELLKQEVGSSIEVFIFNWRVRRHNLEIVIALLTFMQLRSSEQFKEQPDPEEDVNLNDPQIRLLPALGVHIGKSDSSLHQHRSQGLLTDDSHGSR
jgi:hypothetical protein